MPYQMFDTALGPCGLVWTDQGLRRVQLPEAEPELTEAVLRRHANPAPAPPWVQGVIARLQAHLEAGNQDFSDVPVDLAGVSPFHQQVYRSLLRVSAGQTCSYGELAALAGSPGAARAVGQAMARNPLPLIVPCHRVLASQGKPGGFSAHGGNRTKARLLALEGVKL